MKAIVGVIPALVTFSLAAMGRYLPQAGEQVERLLRRTLDKVLGIFDVHAELCTACLGRRMRLAAHLRSLCRRSDADLAIAIGRSFGRSSFPPAASRAGPSTS
jgi:hypothetical protein